MPLCGHRRLLEVETPDADQAAIDELRPIALTGIEVVTLAILFVDQRRDAQCILHGVAEVLVQEVVKSLGAVLEDAHVLVGAREDRLMKIYKRFSWDSRVLWHADAEELLGYDEDHSGNQMEQIEEELVAPAVAQLGRWLPDETIGRVPFDAAVDGITEL